MLHPLLEQLDAVGMVGRQHRVVAAEPLDEAAVARRGRLGDDDPIKRALLRAAAGEANLQGHVLSTPVKTCWSTSCRHCERSEAIHVDARTGCRGLLRRCAPRNDGLPMTLTAFPAVRRGRPV